MNAAKSETPLATASLLFVDDEPNVLSALRRLFRGTGCRIQTCNSAAEALVLLERESVDLVISDMRMPEMNGAQLLERVFARWPETKRILLTGYADAAETIAAINRGKIWRYVSKPWNDEELVLTVQQALAHRSLMQENARLTQLTQIQNDELKTLNTGLEQKVAERTDQLRRALLSLERAHKALKTEFLNSVKVFSSLVELRGGHLGIRLSGHGRRVAEHARILARRMELVEDAVQDVMFAGLLHDIGKIGLRDELLDMPFNSLPPEARSEVMSHPVVGQNLLMGIAELKGAAQLIRSHHEHFDGSGFPDGLAGPQIAPGARILSVANDYDALQVGTLTQRSLKEDEALAYLVGNRGKRYDPAVVDSFVAMLAERRHAAITDIPLIPGNLKPGMVLARDLTHHDGYLLLTAGHTLDAHLIERLAVLEDNDRRPLTVHVSTDSLPA